MDFFLGDPRGIPHIIILFGKMIAGLEKSLRKAFRDTEQGQRNAGRMLVVLMLLFVLLVSAVVFAAYRLWIPLGLVLETFIVWQCLCMKDLKLESMHVYDKLKQKDLPGARYAVSMIVGRDTEVLDEVGVAKAAIETVAENTSDGIIAPLFYMLLFGGCGGLLYKAVNTMDSMVGYRNEKYLHFGRAAALTDDVFNYIPARLAARLMIAAAGLCAFNTRQALKIYKRDRQKHASPNSAHTESVCAGALEIQLAGDAWYFGELHKKEYIGDPIHPVVPDDIKRANKLMVVTTVLMLALITLVRLLVFGGLLHAAI
ncbi:MAG: adenosylcobinamide-phosphate synthase CbiB [Oscillospiraceae bacterium]|nr:adenosylcobinamide-phosphate synthase CbiB [Oscillospiraceae bacterium]